MYSNKRKRDNNTNAYINTKKHNTSNNNFKNNNDNTINELSDDFSKLNISPIKVIVIPFAHSGVMQSTLNNKQLIKKMDIKLITSTPGTCTFIYPTSYITLLNGIIAEIKLRSHITHFNFDNYLLNYFNNFQNKSIEPVINSNTYVTERNTHVIRHPNTQVKEKYIDLLQNTYKMYDYTYKTPTTKYYTPIPKNDPLWNAFQPIAHIMNVNPLDYTNSPFVVYMFVDHNGIFKAGIAPNTHSGITINKILYNINEIVTNELPSKQKVHYLVADPNCAYVKYGISGDTMKLKFGGKVAKKNTNRNVRKTNKNRKNKKVKTRKITLKSKIAKIKY